MEFKFKRKYTFLFFLALLLHIAIVSGWFLLPNDLFNANEEKKIIFFLVLVNVELLLLFYLGLFRKKYYAYFDKILVKRSFFKEIVISYKDITRIKEKNFDTIILGFGHRPSFTIYYETNKRKKYTIRSDNNELLLKIVKNEINISKSNNNTTKKLTK